jgi:plastocyanin
VLGSFAFSIAGYSFVAAQNITDTAPTGNVTAPSNTTTTDATGTTGTGNVTDMGDNQTTTSATGDEMNATVAGGEINTFYARGQIASIISESAGGDNASAEVVGGRLSIDVIDGQVQRVEINMTMSKPDGSDFHTVLIDNFTAGSGETTISNATGGDNMTAAGGDNATTATDAGNETTVESFMQVITGGNETGNATTTGTDNMTAPAGNVTGNEAAPPTMTANVTAPTDTGNETALAQATLSEDGTFEISGSATFYLDNNPQWENVPITIESTGRVITINVDHEMTDNHFMGMPIYGFVTALIGEVNGQRQSVLPPVTTGEAPIAPPAEAPTAPVTPEATDNMTAPAGNETGNETTTMTPPTENATGNETAETTDNQTATTPAPAAGPSEGGGGNTIEVTIPPGSSTKTDDAFDPNPVQASVGDTVRWTNEDTTPHTVTSGTNAQPDGKFDSSPNLNPLLAPQQTFEHTFEEAGEYPYYCAVHPNMVGTVSVS